MDIDAELRNAESSLLDVMRLKTQELQAKMKSKDLLIIKMNSEYENLRSAFESKLEELDQKEETLQELQDKFKSSVSIIDSKQKLIEEINQSWEEKLGKLQENLEVKDYEVRDLQDKLQASTKDVKFYKKGYLEEVSQYKTEIEKLQAQVKDQRTSLLSEFNREKEKIESLHQEHISELKSKQEESLSTLKETLSRELKETSSQLDQKNSRFRILEKEHFTLQNSYENLQIVKDAFEKKVAIMNEQLSSANTEEYRKMMEMRMELQKSLGIKEHMMEELKMKLNSAEEKLKATKRKFNTNISNFQKEYEAKILQLVMEYRSEINDKEKDLKYLTQENESLKLDMRSFAEKTRDRETEMRLAGEELQNRIRDKTRDFEAHIHKLNNEQEILGLRVQELEKLLARATVERDEKSEKLANFQIRVLDLEKENQILIDQLVLMKQHSLDRKLDSQKGLMDRIKEDLTENESLLENDLGNHQGNSGLKDKIQSKLFSSDQGNPSFPEFNGADVRDFDQGLRLNHFMPHMMESRDTFNEKLQLVVSSRLKNLNSNAKLGKGVSPSKLDYVQEENHALKELIEEMRVEMEKASQDFIEQKSQLEEFKCEQARLIEAQKTKDRECAGLREKIAKLDAELESFRNHNSQEFDAKKEECMKLRHEIDTLKSLQNINHEELKHAQMQYDEAMTKISNLESMLSTQQKEIGLLESVRLENIKIRKERDELLTNLSKTRAKMLKYRDNCENGYDTQSLDIILAEIQGLKISNDELSQIIDKKTVENQRLRTQLDRYIHKQPVTKPSKNPTQKEPPIEATQPATKKVTPKIQEVQQQPRVRNFNIKDDPDNGGD